MPGTRARTSGEPGVRSLEPLAKIAHRVVGDEADERVAVLDVLVQRGRAHADPRGDGLHREPREPVGLEDVAPGGDDVGDGRAGGSRHRILLDSY